MSTDEIKKTIIGSAGGKRRAEVLSAKRRSEIARMGAYGRLASLRAAKPKVKSDINQRHRDVAIAHDMG